LIACGFYFARLVFRDSLEQIFNRAVGLRQVRETVIRVEWGPKKVVAMGYYELLTVTMGYQLVTESKAEVD